MDVSAAPPQRRWSRRRKLLMGVSSTLVLGVAAIWLFRAPIADRFAQQQLNDRGVPATYEIDRIGWRTQRLTNLVIGDPKAPDLTARSIELDLRYGWGGPEIDAVRADGVVVRGTLRGGKLSFGALDKFRDPASREPFMLPEIDAALRDARINLATPWGALTGRIDGAGLLSDGFSGQAAVTSAAVNVAPCTIGGIALLGPVAIKSGRVRFDVKGGADGAICKDLANVDAPRVAADVTLTPTFNGWDGMVSVSARRVSGDGFALTAPRLHGSVNGNVESTAANWTLDPAAASLAGGLTGTLGATGGADFGATGVTYRANGKLTGAAVDTVTRRAIADSGKAANDLPVKKTLAVLTQRLAEAAARFDVDFALVQDGEGAPVLRGVDIKAANGVRAAMGAGDQVTLTPLGFAGTVRVDGGGLPATVVKGRWNARGGDAVLTIAPMTADGERLVLAPVRISGGRSGSVRFATSATLSGAVPGGRVDGLVVPLSGGIGSSGTATIDGGCIALRWAVLTVQGVVLDPARVGLCSAGGAPIFKSGRGGGVPRLTIAGGTVTGRTGATPLTMRWRDAWVQMQGNKAAVGGISIDAGTPDSLSKFAIERLDIDFARGGLGGTLAGGGGTIGSVPLLMSSAAGAWRQADGGILFNGGLDVSDTAVPARFQPLRSDDVALRYADGALAGTAGLNEKVTGTRVVNVDLAHVFDGGVGGASLNVPELRFDKTFQPRQLTRLAIGVVANVGGTVRGSGRIDWNDGTVTSNGKFNTDWTDLAAAFGEVRGMAGTISFSDLINLKTDELQVMDLAEINPGIPVRDGKIEYRLIGDNQIAISAGRWPFAGGALTLDPTTLDFGRDVPRRMNFRVVGVSAALFLQEFDFENLAADGIFDGELPLVFDGLGARIENGRLTARTGGGSLAYVGELTNRDLGTMANFAFSALKSLKYESLTINLNGSLTGEMVTDVRFAGISQGVGASRNIITRQIAKLPLIFNVRIAAPFRQLISSAQSLYDPTILIEQNLPALRRQQEERRAKEQSLKEKGAAVQPGASEDVP